MPVSIVFIHTGDPRVARRPNWERGAQNIAFVLAELKLRYPRLNYAKLTIMGHSNGGDMSALFAGQHAGEVSKLITLDQRRYPFPRVAKPKIYSLRSADQPADEGVLPTPAEQRAYGITVIRLEHTNHNDMDNDASEAQRKEINGLVIKFLGEE